MIRHLRLQRRQDEGGLNTQHDAERADGISNRLNCLRQAAQFLKTMSQDAFGLLLARLRAKTKAPPPDETVPGSKKKPKSDKPAK